MLVITSPEKKIVQAIDHGPFPRAGLTVAPFILDSRPAPRMQRNGLENQVE